MKGEKEHFNKMLSCKINQVLNGRQQDRLWKFTKEGGCEEIPDVALSLIFNRGLKREEEKHKCCCCCRRKRE